MAQTIITRAQAVAVYGTQKALANALGISPQAVSLWKEDAPIPQGHALRLKYELNPEAFGGPVAAAAAE